MLDNENVCFVFFLLILYVLPPEQGRPLGTAQTGTVCLSTTCSHPQGTLWCRTNSCLLLLVLSPYIGAVTWLKYCRYGVKLYPINQSINQSPYIGSTE